MSTAVDSIEDTTKHNGLIEATKLIDCYLEQSKDDKDREKYKDQLVHIRRYFDDRYNDVVEQNLLPASAYYRHWKFVGVELHNLNTVLTTDHSCIEIDFRKEALDETLRQIEEPSFTEAEKAVLVLVNFYSSIRQQEKMTHPSNQSVDTKSRLFDILLLSAVDDVMLQLEKKELDFSIYFSESVINRLDEKSKDPTVQVLMNVIRDVEKNYKVGVSGLIKCIRQRDTLYDQDEKMPNFFQLLHEYGQNNREYDISTFLRENNMPLLTPAEHACYYSIFSKYLIKHKQTQINLTMATANDGIQAVGYYDDGTGVHLKMKNLTIFRSQYNVGRKMIEKVYEANVLNLTDSQKPDGKRKFENINMQFLGPTYTSLRDQTRRDLGNFLQERVSLSHDEINGICQSRVLNSSSIPKDYDTMRFIKVLRKNPLNFLHVLVLDEADWGISSESVIDKFLQHLASIEEEIRQSHQIQPSLIILLVSATIDVLACVINKFTDEKQRVDWYNLRHSDENKFGAPYYRDINRLRLCNDLNASLLALPTISDRSLFIAEEYYKTIKNCLNNIIEKQNINWNSSTAGNALKFLLPGNNTEEISTRARSADYYSEENYMVLVRLNLNEHVTHLHGKILRIFKDMSEQIKLDFQPFEVIQLIQDSDSIVQQLSPKAIRYLHLDDQVSESDFDVSRLNNLPCLILVNAKLGRGERLPSSCMAFDVRSRYKGDAADMKGFASTFIQDVGRCCGHHKPEALILMSVTDENQCASGKANSLTLEDIQFPRLHGLLTKDQAATISHPERNTKSYSKLSSYIIVLDAEPQIGKTGAILGMLDILYAEHTSLLKAASIFQRTTVSQRTPNQPSDLKKITADLCRIVDNPDEMIKIRIDKLKNALHANNLFQEYHNLIRQSEAIETLSRSIYNNNLSTPMNSARKAKQDAFTIVDCGCGLYGIVHIFRKNSSELDLPVHVFGIDLHEEILKLEKLKPVIQNVIFTGCVADMASTNQLDLQNTTYNVVLYCLSLFENDITRHICWANNQLKTGGMLIIADVIRRFSQNFRTSVEKHGFEGLDPYTVCDQFEVWIFKKQSCSNDLITVQLNPY